ncbi:hypothetical protein DY000_02051099 [Brassica cretica]|uniref:Uncharacterized protein n=1 Tax=Brassica cretica TaxID=69181 RepID=A0ABQ7FAN1_BRACR|nr:hypothetical protein DY000_02051099 [Brassica cretica]
MLCSHLYWSLLLAGAMLRCYAQVRDGGTGHSGSVQGRDGTQRVGTVQLPSLAHVLMKIESRGPVPPRLVQVAGRDWAAHLETASRTDLYRQDLH